jgi:hypothetical protein
MLMSLVIEHGIRPKHKGRQTVSVTVSVTVDGIGMACHAHCHSHMSLQKELHASLSDTPFF